MIDILPLAQKKAIRRIRQMRIGTSIFVGITVLAGVAVLLLLPTYETTQSRKVTLGTYTKQLEENGEIVASEDIDVLGSRVSNLAQKLAVALPSSPLIYIDTIKANQIQGIRFTGYEFSSPEKRTVQLRGVAANRQVLQQFIAALGQDSRVSVVDSPITNFVKSAESEFTMTITFTQS